MEIELNNKERLILNEMLRLAVWNANHEGKHPFTPTGEEYRTVCGLWNKIGGKA